MPLSSTSHVVIPERCPKCINQPNTAVAAVIAFEGDGYPSIVIERE